MIPPWAPVAGQNCGHTHTLAGPRHSNVTRAGPIKDKDHGRLTGARAGAGRRTTQPRRTPLTGLLLVTLCILRVMIRRLRGIVVAEAAVHAPKTGSRAVRWPLRLASTVTLVVLAGVVIAASVITFSVIRDQERLILKERTGEAAAVIGSAFSGIEESLGLLGTVTRGNPRLFATAAHSVLTTSSEGTLITVQRGTTAR